MLWIARYYMGGFFREAENQDLQLQSESPELTKDLKNLESRLAVGLILWILVCTGAIGVGLLLLAHTGDFV